MVRIDQNTPVLTMNSPSRDPAMECPGAPCAMAPPQVAVDNVQRLVQRVKSPKWLEELRQLEREALAQHVKLAIPRLDRQLTGLNNSPLLPAHGERPPGDPLHLRLGPSLFRQLVIAIGLIDSFTAGLDEALQNRLRARALATGILAHEWSRRNAPVEHAPSPLGLALMRPIGMAVLRLELGTSYQRFLDAISVQQADQRQLETLTLGFDHLDVTDELFRSWRLAELFPEYEQHSEAVVFAEHMVDALLDRQTQSFDEALTHSRKKGLEIDHLPAWITTVEECLHDVAPRILWDLFERVPLRQALKVLLAPKSALQAARGASECAVMTDICPPTHDLRNTTRQTSGSRPIAMLPAEPTTISDCDRLASAVSNAMGHCRRSRAGISLSLAELDGLLNWRRSLGPEIDTLTAHLTGVIQETCEQGAQVLILESGRLALIQPGLDRISAVGLGRQVLDAVQKWSVSHQTTCVTLSMGIASLALPPKNFQHQGLILAAERCLNAAQAAGGATLKSIDIL